MYIGSANDQILEHFQLVPQLSFGLSKDQFPQKKFQAHQILNLPVSAGLARRCLNHIHFQLLAGALIALIVPRAVLHPCVLFSLSSSLLLGISLKCDHSPIKMMIFSELHASLFVEPQPFVADLLAVLRGMAS